MWRVNTFVNIYYKVSLILRDIYYYCSLNLSLTIIKRLQGVLLQLLHRIAIICYPVKLVLGLFALASFGGIIYCVFQQDVGTDIFIPPLITLMGWSACLYGMVSWFIAKPEPIQKSDRLFTRWKKSIIRSFSWVIALLFVICSLGLIYVSYSTVRLTFFS